MIKSFSVILQLLIPLIFGIVFGFYTGFNVPFYLVLAGLIVVLILLNIPDVSRRWSQSILTNVVLWMLFFFIGFYSVFSWNHLNSNTYFTHFKEDGIYQLRVTEPVIEKDNSVQVKGDVFAVNQQKSQGKVLMYFQKSDSALALNYGDILQFKTSFNSVSSNGNPNEFDYKRYLNLFDIHHRGYVQTKDWVKVDEKPIFIFKWAYDANAYLSRLLDQSPLEPDNLAVAKALLIGNKTDLDKDLLRTFSSAGAMHVLAVSGLHVGIILYFLTLIFKWVKRLPFGKVIYISILIVSLWTYALVTGASPSVLRSALMFTFVAIGYELERETSVYQSLFVSAFILILFDPLVIFKVGFQLSYLAVFGIVFLQSKIYNWFYIKNKVFNYIWKISSVSIAAQIATFPLGLYYFHQFPNLFLLSNLLVIPLVGIILALGILFFIFHWVPILSLLLIKLVNLLLSLMNEGLKFVESLSYSIYRGLWVSWQETFLIYIILIFIGLSISYKKAKYVLGSLALTVVFLGVRWQHQLNMQQTNELVVYHVKDELVFDVFYGQQHWFVCSKEMLTNESKMLFHVKHHWYYRAGEEEADTYVDVNQLPSNQLQLGNKRLVIWQGNQTIEPTSIMVLAEPYWVNDSWVEELKQKKIMVVFHPLFPKKGKEIIKEKLPQSQWFDIVEQGAFVTTF